jgi:hypothetical protein
MNYPKRKILVTDPWGTPATVVAFLNDEVWLQYAHCPHPFIRQRVDIENAMAGHLRSDKEKQWLVDLDLGWCKVTLEKEF